MENRKITKKEKAENEQAKIDFNDAFTKGYTLSFEGDEFNYFKCSCEGKPEFENAKLFIEHLKAVHNLEEPIKMVSRMIFHADATKWFQTNNELDFGEFKAYQFCRCLRRGKNKEHWSLS